MKNDIMASGLPLKEKNQRLSKLITVQNRKVNIMLAGATGSGKSSTINVLFQMEVAKVGVGVAPETEDISKFELDKQGAPLIDLVLVILDASSKDLGTSNELINDVIIPCLGNHGDGRILIGLNQADNINDDKDNWCYDDEEDNYIKETQKGFLESIADFVAGGAEAGGEIGERLLGVPGKTAGALVGGVFGAVRGFIHTLFG